MGILVHSPGEAPQTGRHSWMEMDLPRVPTSRRTSSANVAGTCAAHHRLTFSTSRSGRTVATAKGYRPQPARGLVFEGIVGRLGDDFLVSAQLGHRGLREVAVARRPATRRGSRPPRR